MPGYTYLSDAEIREWKTVKDDPECDELLQEVRKKTGENWVISVRTHVPRKRFLRKQQPEFKTYTLYIDARSSGIEFQVINLCTPDGGSVFTRSDRSDVMNYLMGTLNGWDTRDQQKKLETEPPQYFGDGLGAR